MTPVLNQALGKPGQRGTEATGTGARKAKAKSERTRAREFALQALYQRLVGQNPVAEIDAFTRELSGFAKADAVHFTTLLTGCCEQTSELDALIAPLLDRSLVEISPVEHGVLWIGAFELQSCPDVPWRVVLNECIELAKEFGGTDGHKYVNAVLNQLAQRLRAAEVNTERSLPRA